MSTEGIVGPFFFDATVTAESYLAMLQKQLLALLQQQGGAEDLHFCREHWPIMLSLCETGWMPTCLIDGLAGDDLLSGHLVRQISPHLTFLCGVLSKRKQAQQSPATLLNLKEQIRAAIAQVPLELCVKV